VRNIKTLYCRKIFRLSLDSLHKSDNAVTFGAAQRKISACRRLENIKVPLALAAPNRCSTFLCGIISHSCLPLTMKERTTQWDCFFSSLKPQIGAAVSSPLRRLRVKVGTRRGHFGSEEKCIQKQLCSSERTQTIHAAELSKAFT
jgi:hypothetical protein